MNSKISAKRKIELVRKLARIVKFAGRAILRSTEEIGDMGYHEGHEVSSIDAVARRAIIEALEKIAPELEGCLHFELMPYDKKLITGLSCEADITLIMDEIDGTTNTKRGMAALLKCAPKAGICIALCTSKILADLQIGVVFTLDTEEVFSGIRIEDVTFYAFKNQELIYPEDIQEMHGDSQYRIIIAKYSNSQRVEIAKAEEALWMNSFRPYEGCRSSTMDILSILRNQYDAYIDLRALFPEGSGARLQVYDVASVIPIALGTGLVISDAFGNSWEIYSESDTIPLVVSRPKIHSKILASIKPIVEDISKRFNYVRKVA